MRHPIPIEVFEQHAVALGKTGSGKSYALAGIIAKLLDAGKRVCVVDPKGDHYGLALGADGKSAGYPIVLFGDFKNPKASMLHINERSGKELAELILSGNRPCVIGMRGWMPSAVTKFWIDFASTTYSKLTSPLHLVIDEVHNFAPKGKILSPEAGLCLHWSTRLATEGRGIGLRLLAASVRPQKVHNDFLAGCETLIAMRMTLPADKQAVQEWLREYSTDNARGRLVLDSLSSMQRGESFTWSPEAGFFERIKFPAIKTFDSYASPKEGKQQELKGWAEVDLDDVQKRLGKILEEAKQNDPAALRRRIAELEKQLRTGGKGKIDESIVTRAVEQAVAKVQRDAAVAAKSYEASIARLQATMKRAAELLVGSAVDLPKAAVQQVPAMHQIPKSRPAKPPVQPANIDGALTNPEQRILDAIMWMESIGIDTPEQPAVAFLAGYRFGGGAYNNPRGALRTKGMIEYVGNRVRLTDAGRAVANAPEAILTDDELHNRVLDRLPSPEQRLLKPLLEAYPDALTNEQLAEASGYVVNTGGYNNPRGRLRTLGLVEYIGGGQVKACDLLFPNKVTA